MYKLEFSKQCGKYLEKLNDKDFRNITNKLKLLSENPYRNDLDIKLLHDREKIFRLRIGKYRAKYKVEKDILIIFVIEINHRKDIYR